MKEFILWLKRHAKSKAQAYDGVNKEMSSDVALRYAIEELGEVSTAMTRRRWQLALAECIDLAHCAYLIFKAIKNENKLNGQG